MQCVVLAAGEGKRMRPLTANRPKVMLPLANKPMAGHLLCAARESGIHDFIFVVGYQEQEVRDYFGDGKKFGVRVRYVTQRHQRRTADAFRSAEGLVDRPFFDADNVRFGITSSIDIGAALSGAGSVLGLIVSWKNGLMKRRKCGW